MKFLLNLFIKRNTFINDINQLTLELKKINQNKNLNPDECLEKLRTIANKAQDIIKSREKKKPN